VNWDLLPLPLLYLSAFFEQNRPDYYDSLLAVSERGAWREWVLFFLHGVADQARDTVSRIKHLQDLQLEWRGQLQKARVTGLVLGIVDLLFESPILSANQVVKRFGVTHPTAMQALRRLEEHRIVQEITGKKRNRIYVAANILETLT